MTPMIPESIIQKIMLYNSHQIADIIKTHYNCYYLKEYTRYSIITKNDAHNIECRCGNIIRTCCSKCRQNIDDVECY